MESPLKYCELWQQSKEQMEVVMNVLLLNIHLPAAFGHTASNFIRLVGSLLHLEPNPSTSTQK